MSVSEAYRSSHLQERAALHSLGMIGALEGEFCSQAFQVAID